MYTKILKYVRSLSVPIMILVCFFCSACNIKNISSFNLDKNKVDKEIVFDIDALIQANTYEELIKSYGSIYITDTRYDVNNEVVDKTDIYEDDNGNIAFRMYESKSKKNIADCIYDIKIGGNWYIATENGEVGQRYNITDDEKLILESLTCIEKYNGDKGFINKKEIVTNHYIDEEGRGVCVTAIGDFKDDTFASLYNYYGKDIGIEKLSKIVLTYTYDVDTLAIISLKGEGVNEKGNTYLVSNSYITLGEGVIPVIKNVQNNLLNIKTYDEIVEKNTYDQIIKKYNSVKVETELEKNYDKLLSYEVYGDFRGITSFKSWDYTVNTLYSLSPTHIREANGEWYKTRDGKSVSKDYELTKDEKIYYEYYNPIEGVFNQKSLILDKNVVFQNYIKDNEGHLICVFDSLFDMYKNYRKSVIEDLDRDVSMVKVDYTYNVDDFIIKKVDAEVVDKNDKIDKRMVSVKIDYDIEAPEYALGFFYDKEFKLEYKKLFDANTDINLLLNNEAIMITDTRYKSSEVKDKEVVLYKDEDGTFYIKDDKNIIYMRNADGYVYKIEDGKKTEISNLSSLDVFVRYAFEKNDIVKAFYNDDKRISLINDSEKLLVCYNDAGNGKLITTNEDKSIRVEYVFDIKDKTVKEIKFYTIENGKMNLKYMTKVEKVHKNKDF